jgi:hypothetical protein
MDRRTLWRIGLILLGLVLFAAYWLDKTHPLTIDVIRNVFEA